MKKDEIILFLQQLVDSQKKQIEDLLSQVAALTQEISSLREILVQNGIKQEEALKRAEKTIKALTGSKSERQIPVSSTVQSRETPEGGNAVPQKRVHAKTNHGAKRLEHYEVETKVVDVYPDTPGFDALKAKQVATRDVIRYTLIPMKFQKVIYRVHKFSLNGKIIEGKAPDTPFLNSNYDGSFIAGIAHLRYMYSMPVERIVKYFNENGFDIQKATAHGLLTKTETLFENLYKALGVAVKEDKYLAVDETYHNVLVKEKNKNGKGIKKGYLWASAAVNLGLAYFFYDDGSRRSDIFFRFIKGYKGVFQSDAYAAYKTAQKWYIRLGCMQHVKRKFLDCGDDFDAKVIVRLINHIYHLDHKHCIGKDGWTVAKHRKWRKKKCKPIMKLIKKKLNRMVANANLLPKTEKYEAVHYMLGEWDALMNIFRRGDYHLDNNLIERLNRYVSLSRRNSLFFGSHKGAERGAMFYSLVCSCRMQNINFFEYISDIINKAACMPPNTPIEKYRELLPDRWKNKRLG